MKRVFASSGIGRHVVMHLGKGELILENIEDVVQKLNIKTAVVSGIGAARKMRFHRILNTNDLASNEIVEIEGPIEVGSITGLAIDGRLHLHTTFSTLERTYAGHMEHGCEVQYIAEISILELSNAPYIRAYDEFGISYITKGND